METVKQLKSAHRAANTKVSLKAFVKALGESENKDFLSVLRTAHKRANKARSETTIATTKIATSASREARRKRSNNGKVKKVA
jgi:hypothetical protein